MDNQSQDVVDIQPIKKPRKKREKPVDKQLVITLGSQGYSKSEIARKADCDRTTVYDILDAVNDKKNEIHDFLQNRSNVHTLLQKKSADFISKCLDSLEDDLEAGRMKPSEKGKNMFYAGQGFGIFYDKDRIEKGKATSITAGIQLFMVQALEQV